jgi:hypothetical protein
MIRDHGLAPVLSEEAGDAGVVPALGSRIVQAVPTDLELVPAEGRQKSITITATRSSCARVQLVTAVG